ncbi:MAG: 1-pyrroline-5-carboxylate dehydrogenase, partial [Actinomycetota bacterium]|nr:1-pyrroline-5-carboxylate dehydrogenase [Actinomycetota bacterium]
MDAITRPPAPTNEPNLSYAPGRPERAGIEVDLVRLQGAPLDLTATIGGKHKMGGGAEVEVVAPHDHASVLGVLKQSTK